MRRRFGAAAPVLRRISWGIGDQALSSLINFALGILVARSVSTEDFGAFSIALVTYWTALGVVRALTSQPLVVRYSAVTVESWRIATAAATGTSVVLGLGIAVACLVVSAPLSGALKEAFLALAVVLPGLLLQDTWRFAFFAAGRGRAAFMNDLAWAVTLIPTLLFVVSADRVAILWPMIAWGLSGLTAALAGSAQSRIVPSPVSARAWMTMHRDLATRYVAESLTTQGSAQIATYAVAGIGGLAAVGILRLGQLLVNPVYFVFQGMYLIGVPEAVRALAKSPALLSRVAFAIGLGLAALVLAWTVAVTLVPSSVGIAVLGQSWEDARLVFIPLALAQAASGVISGALIAMRALAAAHRSLVATIVGAITTLAASIVGVVVAGAYGVAWLAALAATVNIGVWWWQYRTALAEHALRGTPARPVHDGSGVSSAHGDRL